MSKFGDLGKVKRIDDSEEELFKAEVLRYRAFGIPLEGVEDDCSFYYYQIKNKAVIPYALYIRGRMVAGCYVSHTYDSLFIDQLFVMPELQESGLKLGRLLLRYVLANKDELSQEFNTELTHSSLESINQKTTAIYQKEGYEKKGFLMTKKLR